VDVVVASPPPHVAIASAPLAVVGRDFEAGAPVVLRLTLGTLVKVVRTTADGHGAFRAAISRWVPTGTCTGNISVIAITRGRRPAMARFAHPCVPLAP
jgi:hypothetical protein